MKVPLIFIVLNLLFQFSGVKAQTYTTVSESRKSGIKSVLDYRYKGGFYTFEKDFYSSVTFPDAAKLNCRIGICIASAKIDCDGNIVEITLKNPLKLGIDEAITNFFNSTAGKWNPCSDDKYTKFDIPIQFTVDGIATNTEDALLIISAEPIPGQTCFDDEYYLEKAQKALRKKNGKKALQNIQLLVRRNPYNTDYYEMQKEAISFLEK